MNPSLADTALSVSATSELEAVAYSQARDIFAMLSLQAPLYEPVSRGSVDIMAVIDRSGSMAGSKLNLVKQTLTFVVEQLKETDRLGIVTFDDGVDTPLALTTQDEGGKARTLSAIRAIQTGGSTNLCGGVVQGILQMRERDRVADVSSVLVFTDGQANVGIVTADGIQQAMRATGEEAQKAIHGEGGERRMQRVQPSRGGFMNRITSSFRAPAPAPTPAPALAPAPATTTAGTSAPLPCSVYTFGYGADHDPSLLKSIADSGEGVYYFIENNDKIGESFADCLGGLLSVMAKDITITVTAMNGSSISKVHSKYRQEEVRPGQEYRLKIDNIQSEEQKDVLFTVKLPALGGATSDFQYFNAKVEYMNVVANQNATENVTLALDRPEVEPEGQQVNYMLDKQRNRIIAASAIEEAVKLADSGRLEDAKALLQRTEEQILNSVSGSDPFCADVIKGLHECKEGLRDARTWETRGAKVALNSVSAHWNQRSSNMSSEAQTSYQTASRKVMRSKFM